MLAGAIDIGGRMDFYCMAKCVHNVQVCNLHAKLHLFIFSNQGEKNP